MWLLEAVFSFNVLCILFRVVPGCLGSLGHFKNKYSDPIEQGQRHSATKRTLATGRKAVRALVKIISHLFLRRTKALIREQLPKKDDRVRLFKFNHTSLKTPKSTVYMSKTFHRHNMQIIFYDIGNSKIYVLFCFLLGGVLLSDGFSADCLSDRAGHWRCDIDTEVLREMWLSKWT